MGVDAGMCKQQLESPIKGFFLFEATSLRGAQSGCHYSRGKIVVIPHHLLSLI